MCLVTGKNTECRLSFFKIEWVEMASYANRLPTCMLLGGNFTDNGEVTGWKSFESLELAEKSIFVVKQDIRLLKEYVVKYWVDHIELMLSKHVVKRVKLGMLFLMFLPCSFITSY